MSLEPYKKKRDVTIKNALARLNEKSDRFSPVLEDGIDLGKALDVYLKQST